MAEKSGLISMPYPRVHRIWMPLMHLLITCRTPGVQASEAEVHGYAPADSRAIALQPKNH